MASVPGRMNTWRSAIAAVSARRGSTMTTRRPPRRRIASSRFFTPGAVITLPLETTGLAPMMTRWSVRSMSGTGISAWLP